MAATVLEELNQTMESSDKRKGRRTTYIINVRRVVRDQMGKQSNAWKVYQKYIRSIGLQIISEDDAFLWFSRGDQKAESES